MNLLSVTGQSHLVLCAAVVLPVGVAALHDLAGRTVPDRCCAAIAVVGLVAATTAQRLPLSLLVCAAVFALGIAAWRCRWMGGGDVKLLAALALALPPDRVPALIGGTAIAGALLALPYLIGRHMLSRPTSSRPTGRLARIWRAERWRLARGGPLPYAVAIAAGLVAVLARGGLA